MTIYKQCNHSCMLFRSFICLYSNNYMLLLKHNDLLMESYIKLTKLYFSWNFWFTPKFEYFFSIFQICCSNQIGTWSVSYWVYLASSTYKDDHEECFLCIVAWYSSKLTHCICLESKDSKIWIYLTNNRMQCNGSHTEVDLNCIFPVLII